MKKLLVSTAVAMTLSTGAMAQTRDLEDWDQIDRHEYNGGQVAPSDFGGINDRSVARDQDLRAAINIDRSNIRTLTRSSDALLSEVYGTITNGQLPAQSRVDTLEANHGTTNDRIDDSNTRISSIEDQLIRSVPGGASINRLDAIESTNLNQNTRLTAIENQGSADFINDQRVTGYATTRVSGGTRFCTATFSNGESATFQTATANECNIESARTAQTFDRTAGEWPYPLIPTFQSAETRDINQRVNALEDSPRGGMDPNLVNQVNSVETRVNENRVAIDANRVDIDANRVSIDANRVNIQRNTDRIEMIEVDIDQLRGDVRALENRSDGAIASAHALSNVVGYGDGIALGIGAAGDSQATALGIQKTYGNVSYRLNGTRDNRGNKSWGAGIGIKF